MTREGLIKHWDVIKQWKDDPEAVVEKRFIPDGVWLAEYDHGFSEKVEYRIRPKIEAWAVLQIDGRMGALFGTKEGAERFAFGGASIIRLVPEKEAK